LRHFAEMLIAIGFFYVVVNCAQEREQLERLTLAILLVGAVAAGLGVLLYFIPAEWTVRLLSSLSRFGYPTGGEVLRYIEDDPAQPLRAISTSIDPNAFGGLMVLVTAVMGGQLFSPRPLLRRPIVAGAFAVAALALMLTFSRSAMLGLAVALLFLGLVRYRRLLPLLLLGALLFLVLPQTQGYVQRFVEGFQRQDLATQMRFGEYKDALILISRYPWLGVGFSSPPDIDLYLGVSNLYLIIAEQVGLIGLGIFAAVMAGFFFVTMGAWRRTRPAPRLESILLGYVAAAVGVLVVGIFDHYFFNINFIHLVTFFWISIGLGVAAARLAAAQPGGDEKRGK
jgi:O-antigen ligase